MISSVSFSPLQYVSSSFGLAGRRAHIAPRVRKDSSLATCSGGSCSLWKWRATSNLASPPGTCDITQETNPLKECPEVPPLPSTPGQWPGVMGICLVCVLGVTWFAFSLSPYQVFGVSPLSLWHEGARFFTGKLHSFFFIFSIQRRL